MPALHTAKPATARDGEPVSKIEWLGGPLNPSDTQPLTDRQALWLARRFLLSAAMATAIAPHVFEVRP
jgi:hypothetical protein